jgi:hypothetical protein
MQDSRVPVIDGHRSSLKIILELGIFVDPILEHRSAIHMDCKFRRLRTFSAQPLRWPKDSEWAQIRVDNIHMGLLG